LRYGVAAFEFVQKLKSRTIDPRQYSRYLMTERFGH